jgi:alpha-beta hydrolase superfamily lysophospholipase
VQIDVEAGVRLHGWYFPATVPARALVVACHGGGGNITGYFPKIAWMLPEGIDVLTFDYRGFGRSTGTPDRAGVVADGLAATRFGLEMARRQNLPVVLLGNSGGGMVAVAAAAREPGVAAVVLDCTYSSHLRAVTSGSRQVLGAPLRLALWPVWKVAGRWLISDAFDPLHEIHRIAPRPVLIMHGKKDHILDWHQAVELHKAAGEPKDLWLVEDCGHCLLQPSVDLNERRIIWDACGRQAQARFLQFLETLN